MSKKVFINAGHGGNDPGAVGYVKEKDCNLITAKACRDYLIARGVNAYMSEADINDQSQGSSDILKEISKFNPDYALDIHFNAGKGDGFEAYYGISGLGKPLAQNIEKEVKKIGQNSRGLKTKKGSTGRDYYYFIRETSCPAVILEGAFVDNKADASQIDTEAECRAFGEAYARGILATLGISDTKPAISVSSSNTHVVKKGETLTKIAKKYNTTVDTLVELNDIEDKNSIAIGQIIKLPGAKTETKVDTKVETKTETTSNGEKFDNNYRNGKTYVVTANGGLNLRKGYGKTYASMGILANGTRVTWYGYSKIVNGETWKKVKVDNGSLKGKTGYVCATYLK